MAREAGQTKRVRVAEGVYRVQRKDGTRYQIAIYHGANGDGPAKRKWHTLPKGTTLPRAKKAKRELEDKKHAKTSTAPETVRGWSERWNGAFPKKASTMRHNNERVKPFVRDFGDRTMASIEPKEARLWIMGGTVPPDLEDAAREWHGVEESGGRLTVPKHTGNRAAVRVFMGDARRAGVIQGNPFENLQLPQSRGRKDNEVLTADEVDKLAIAAKKVHGEYGELLADMILTAAWTGLRPGELFALIPERVDFDAGVLHVVESADNHTGKLWETKTQSGARTVVLLPKARKALEHTIEAAERVAGEFIFQPPRPRNRWHHEGVAAFRGMGFGYYFQSVRDVFTAQLPASHWLPQRVQKKGNLGKFVLYELRHAYGTRLAEAGVPAEDIAGQMGHNDGGVLAMQTYVHVARSFSEDRVRQAFAA